MDLVGEELRIENIFLDKTQMIETYPLQDDTLLVNYLVFVSTMATIMFLPFK